MTTTKANITWTLSLVEYHPVNYTVIYHGTVLQKEPKMTEWIFNDPTNNPVASEIYLVVLQNLEEANVYNYTIQATNCYGTIITDTMQFTTLPDSEFL